MSFERVPTELQAVPQWVCWNGSKLPIDPKTGQAASSVDPSTWAPYAVAVQAAENFNGIGFVLTENDPYTFIDLDYSNGDPEAGVLQKQTFDYLDSYTEVSPSGRGLHIIVKARCPYSRRRNHIEVYGSKRYMTMTGNIYHDRPIEERQLHVEKLLNKLGGAPSDIPIIDGDQIEEDDVLWDRMFEARNGDAILALANGEWQDKYGSQSEADFALVNHLVFYSKSPAQVARMFRQSKLGQRDKAMRDDYVSGMIRRASDQFQPDTVGPYIDIARIKAKLVDGPRPTMTAERKPPQVENSFPAGLVGELAQFIYSTYPRPVPEIAVAGAIGLMAGICGRAYNISGTGLNMYTLLLAKTGVGKDAMAQGISRIRQQLLEVIPAAGDFIGPSFASGQALSRHLAEKSASFVSIFGEFGKQLARYSSPTANMADRALATLFLDLYSKSGRGVHLPGTTFADTAKNTPDMLSPAFSILGEATPETYYDVVDEQAIAEGLLPRFLVIEYDGPRVPKRDVRKEDFVLHPDVLERLADLADGVLRLMAENNCVDVQLSPEAEDYLNKFDKAADARINASTKDTTRQLWNRAHLKALKLAGLLAVGCNQYAPVVTLEQAQWAQTVVERDILRVIARFESGDLGQVGAVVQGHEKRVAVVRRCLRQYPEYDPTEPSNVNIKPGMQEAGIVPHSTLRRHACAFPAFRKIQGYKTPSQLFDEVMKQLLEDEVVRKVDQQYLRDNFDHRGAAYHIVDP